LVCVFQPHRYSRTQLLHEEFGSAFVSADKLVLTDIYGAGEAPIPGIDGRTVLEEVQRQSGQDVTYVPEREKLAGFLAGEVQEGDLVITMGAGDIYKTGEELVGMLKK
jgi:UDP-N-acetylmuramate--alanine ligase